MDKISVWQKYCCLPKQKDILVSESMSLTNYHLGLKPPYFLITHHLHQKSKYGNDFFKILKKDFGLSNFDIVRDKISNDFKQSIYYYLNNKHYNITESTFGQLSDIRFEDYEIYDLNEILSTIEVILNNCINFNLQSLKRRDLNIKSLPKQFAITELQKEIKNNLDSFNTYSERKRNVYSPDGTITIFNDATSSFVEPARGTLLNTFCRGYNRYGKIADGNGGSYEELIETNSTICGYTAPPSGGGGGGGTGIGGGGTIGNDPNDGRERTDGGLGRTENIR